MHIDEAKKVVLCFSGFDPSGGAGMQADAEAIVSHACHAAGVITALTVQNTRAVDSYQPVSSSLIIQQARSVLEDMPVQVIKIGMLGSVEAAEAVHSVLVDYPKIPVVFDPVLAAGGGETLAQENLCDVIKEMIIPLCQVVTPNTLEAKQLALHGDNDNARAIELLDMGCEHVLLTGTHAPSENVVHKLFANNRCLQTYMYARLPHEYHGSGCTLAASVASFLAQGEDVVSACHAALDYTYKTLQHAQALGMGQLIPDRFFWTSS